MCTHFCPLIYVDKECYSLENQIDVNKLLNWRNATLFFHTHTHTYSHAQTQTRTNDRIFPLSPCPTAYIQTIIRISLNILAHSLSSIYTNKEHTDFLTAAITVSTSSSFILYGFLNPFICLVLLYSTFIVPVYDLLHSANSRRIPVAFGEFRSHSTHSGRL